MATFQELMRAAENAEGAGDEAAARQLVQMAASLRPTAQDAPAGDYPPSMLPQTIENSAPAVPQVDRFGDTIAAATKGPREAFGAFAGGMIDETQSPTHGRMPEWMPERLKSAASLAADTGGAALSALGVAASGAAGAIGEVFGGDPTQEKKLARDVLMGLEVSAPQLAGVSGATRAAGKASRAVQKLDAPQTDLQQSAQAASDLGITPSLGAGGKVRGMTAAALEKAPIAGGAIGRDADRFVGEIEEVFNRAVSKTGTPLSADAAGSSLQRGAQAFVDKFKVKSKELYGRVGESIPKGTKIQAAETAKAIRDVEAMFADTPEIARQIGVTQLSKLADDLEGGLSWEAASALRSEIGKSIGKMKGVMTDQSDARLKDAYKNLTRDLETAAEAAGPEAAKAWRAANAHYARGRSRIDKDLDKFISADNPERAFEAFSAMARKGRAASDVGRMRRIKESIPKEEWGEVSASIVDRLGRSKSGQQNAAGDAFSPNTFLTEWNNLTPEARNMLLPAGPRVELNKLAKVAELAKKAGAERNMSNTGTATAGFFTGMGLVAAPAATTAGVTGLTIASKAMTNKRFLVAMNNMARGNDKAMRALAASDRPHAQDAASVLRMSGAGVGSAPANTDGQPAIQAVN